MSQRSRSKTATCEDCGTRVQTYLGSAPRYPVGVRTETDTYICGPCMGARHAAKEEPRGHSEGQAAQ
jgi:hypothetical protein